MVQRKVSNKLGIQTDHFKSEKRLVNLKPSPYQYQDGKTRGPDMKKKMKRSRSIKLSDIESLRSPPGEPPSLNVTTPQKQQTPVRTNYGSPNYMKGTSSSEARKESAQVSSRRCFSDSKSKLGSCSSAKPARSLTKSSSFKLVRTLTQTPSFKHVRAGSKNCSRVVLCADMNVQRSTCCSTLKDSKFPDYLVLNPGGTEVEGTSVMKVCPYTYCSLNGHHHKPVLPLKCFLSARRRMLKTHMNMKLEALSPHKVKPVDKGIDAEQVIFDNKTAYTGDLDGSPMSLLIEERGMDFFIKIYAESKEENGESIHRDCHEAEEEHSNDEQIAEDLSAGSPRSEIDFDENLEQYSVITPMGVNIMEGFTEEEKVENPDKDYSAMAAQTEGMPDDGSDFEDESNASSEDNGSISEGSDMELEDGQFPTLEIDTEAEYSMKDDYESDFDNGYLSEINNHGFSDDITKSDNIVVSGKEKVEADEIFEEESACSKTLQEDRDLEMDYMHQNLEIIESSQVSDSDQESTTEEAEADLDGVMIASAWTEDPIVEPTASIEEIEEKTKVPEAENEIPGPGPHVGDAEKYFTLEATDETFNHQQKDKFVQDDDLAKWLQNLPSDSFQDSDKGDQVATDEDYNGNQDIEDSKIDQVAISEFLVEQDRQKNEAGDQMEEKEQVAATKRSIGVQVPDDLFEAYFNDGNVDDSQNYDIIDPCRLEHSAEDSNSSQDTVDEILPSENQEHPSEGEYSGTGVDENQHFVENNEDKDEVKKFNVPSSMNSEEESDSGMNKISLAESGIGEVEKIEVEESRESDTTETLPVTGTDTIPKLESTSLSLKSKSNPEVSTIDGNQKWTIRSKRPAIDEEEIRSFNPREPNFLPLVPDPDSEKVDLKHQMMDERKNSEEWMVDYALRQAVTKLAPARKRKVALLVEAFETVVPVPKCETRLRHSSAAFSPARPMQACS